jgi:TATA-binding related factor (TRF) of subunit 20 of Mediator complex
VLRSAFRLVLFTLTCLGLFVRSLYNVRIEGNATPASVEKEVVRRVRAHTGRRTGAWEVSLAILATPDKSAPTLAVVTLSDVPGRRFVLSPSTLLVAEVGDSFPSMLKKLSSYAPRSTRVVRGAAYDFADLVVRVGISFDRGAPAGVVVEIEYRPCADVGACASLVTELMDRIAAPLVPPPLAGQDPSASAAATAAYAYERVLAPETEAEDDGDDVGERDATEDNPPRRPFSNHDAARLFVNLLS